VGVVEDRARVASSSGVAEMASNSDSWSSGPGLELVELDRELVAVLLAPAQRVGALLGELGREGPQAEVVGEEHERLLAAQRPRASAPAGRRPGGRTAR
jgi:hypothetical protein